MQHETIIAPPVRETSFHLPAYSLHLDMIRGLAALVVLYGHLHLVVTGHGSDASVGQTPYIAMRATGGLALPHAAVVVFFVLSGYLVGGSVVRDLSRGRFTWQQYSLRRLTRLWTVLIPALVFGTLLDTMTKLFFFSTNFFKTCIFTNQLHGLPTALNFLRYLFFMQTVERFPAPRFGTNGALWSLSSEFWYYVLFPFVAIPLLSRRTRMPTRIASAALVAILLWFVGARIGLAFPIWLLGASVYVVPIKIPARHQVMANLLFVIQFLAVLFVLRVRPTIPIVADGLVGISFALLLYGLLHRVGPTKRSLYSRLAHGISFPSYTLYACHVPMVVLLTALFEARFPNLFSHSVLASILILILVVIYIATLYFCFERNTDRIRKFIENQLVSRKVVTGQPAVMVE
jgi:peptidoglycan/LPS O-acetylase OafA/YrhL